MGQSSRILIAVLVLVLIVGVVLGVEVLRRQSQMTAAAGQAAINPGDVPISLAGQVIARFSPTDLDRLKKVSFVEPVENKTEEGWLLHDVLLLYLPEDRFQPDTRIIVSSSSRGKSAELSWTEVAEPANMVMFDLSNRGTLKLASRLAKLDTREEWVQDVDKIEIQPAR